MPTPDYEALTCLGGPFDGERISIPPGSRFYQIFKGSWWIYEHAVGSGFLLFVGSRDDFRAGKLTDPDGKG